MYACIAWPLELVLLPLFKLTNYYLYQSGLWETTSSSAQEHSWIASSSSPCGRRRTGRQLLAFRVLEEAGEYTTGRITGLKRAQLKQAPLVLQWPRPSLDASGDDLDQYAFVYTQKKNFQDHRRRPITLPMQLVCLKTPLASPLHRNDGDSIDKINQIYLFICCLHRPQLTYHTADGDRSRVTRTSWVSEKLTFLFRSAYFSEESDCKGHV